MSSTTQNPCVQPAWRDNRNARTLRAFMALRNQDIADRLKQLRADKGNPPQTTVAKAIDVGERTYQSWEQGDAKPSYRNLQALAEYYGVGEDYILTGQSQAETPNPFRLSDQMDGGFDEFRAHVSGIHARLDQLKAEQRDQRRLLEQATSERAKISELVAKQAQLLEDIQKVVKDLAMPDGVNLPDHVATVVERTVAQSRSRRAVPRGPA